MVPWQSMVQAKAIQEMIQFASIGEILLSEGFGDMLWYVCRVIYILHIIRLMDMRIGRIEKVK